MIAGSDNGQPEEIARYEAAFQAIAAGADNLACRNNGYHILMGASRQVDSGRHFEQWSDVVAALETLTPDALPIDTVTARYVADIHRALHTFARVRAGETITYLDQVAAYLDFDDIWIAERELESLQADILHLLEDLGLPGELARGLQEWELARTVETSRIGEFCAPLVGKSKRASLAIGIPIPEQAEVDVTVRSTPYYAYAHYFGAFRGNVELTSDLLWTVEGLKHSICHEAFPGHQASASAKEWAVEQGTWADVRLPGLANSPTSPISEGLAENGTRMLGWIENEHDRLFSLQNRLQFGVRTNAAIMRHEHGEPRDAAIAYMMREAGVPEDWAEYHEAFISDPLWHTSFPHYWHGTTLVDQALTQFQGRERELFVSMYAHPQTTGTLRALLAEDALASDNAANKDSPVPTGGSV